PPDGAGHFIIKIEAFAAAGRLEFTKEDLARDNRTDIESLIREMATRSPDDLENEVYRALRFDLCRQCHRRYLVEPLAAIREFPPS
ncbi:MAG TPA: hypothetical protein VNT79_06365, partial [Phycisphaerae bacterium]|nr:hypothetical protein [Phycisphaerae bacterium]